MASNKKTRTTKRPSRKPKAVKTAAIADSIGIGTVVMVDDGTTLLGPCRVCAELALGQVCVMFGEGIGCRRVAKSRLRPAPAGSKAPECDGCDDC